MWVETVSLQGVNSEVVWVCGSSGVILHSNDTGATWRFQNSTTHEDLHSIQFVTGTMGYAVGTNGTIIKTSDAGVTWKKLNSGKKHERNPF